MAENGKGQNPVEPQVPVIEGEVSTSAPEQRGIAPHEGLILSNLGLNLIYNELHGVRGHQILLARRADNVERRVAMQIPVLGLIEVARVGAVRIPIINGQETVVKEGEGAVELAQERYPADYAERIGKMTQGVTNTLTTPNSLPHRWNISGHEIKQIMPGAGGQPLFEYDLDLNFFDFVPEEGTEGLAAQPLFSLFYLPATPDTEKNFIHRDIHADLTDVDLAVGIALNLFLADPSQIQNEKVMALAQGIRQNPIIEQISRALEDESGAIRRVIPKTIDPRQAGAVMDNLLETAKLLSQLDASSQVPGKVFILNNS